MPTPLNLSWSSVAADETSIAGGFTQNAGGINVAVSYSDDGLGSSFTVESTDTQYVGAGEPMSTTSGANLTGAGGTGDTSTVTVDFDSVGGSGYSSEVENVMFRINDTDNNTWTDILYVRAYDANGNQIDVSMTYQGATSTGTDPSVTGTGGNGSAASSTGSILVEIAGPVAYFEIDYNNSGTGGQALWLTDVHFDAIDLDGTVEGTAGNDVIDDTYILDPDGDKVDSGDAILPGHGTNDDLIEAYGGNDSVTAGAGNDTIYAGTGTDTVDAGIGNDTVFGEAGADSILGGAGADSIYAGADNDTVYGGADNDYVELGSGNDTFGDWSTDAGDDTVYGGDGADYINGGTGNDQIYGDAGNDTLVGAAGNDSIYGGTGNDAIWITDDHNNDVIVGGEDVGNGDTDTVSFYTYASTQGITVTATGDEAGTYAFDGTTAGGSFSEIEAIETTDYSDTVDMSLDTGGADVSTFAGDDVITTGSGADTVDGGQGADTFNTGAGDDVINLGDNGSGSPDGDADVVVLQDGSDADTITNFDAPTPNGDGTFTGIDTFDVTALTDGTDPVNTHDVTVTDDGSGNAVLTFPNGESVTLIGISPTTADDPFWLNAAGIPLPDGTVEGTAGADTIDASYTGDPDGDMVDAGDAILAGHASNDDLIYGYGGNDSIVSGAGNDTVYGGSGSDTINGGAGADALDGGADADTIVLDSGFGSDVITGGETGTDSDTVQSTQNIDMTVTASGNEAGSITDGTSTATFSEIEAIETEGGNDTINLSADTTGMSVASGAGADTITGGSGDDTLSGEDGTDLIYGGLGADTMDGGLGSDTFVIEENFGNDSITGGEDTGPVDIDVVDAGGMTSDVTLNFTGSEAGTLSDGTSTADFSEVELFSLGSGNDTVVGGAGNEFVYAGAGNDTMSGGAGADTLIAGSGDDTITFAEGDSASGGSGDDLFVLEDLGEPTNGTITIDGGSETGADTLQLGSLGVLTNDVISSFVDDGTGSYSGSITLDDGTILNFSEIENIICFTPGTRIATPQGAVAVEDLEVGDLVVTRDHGLQPVRWIEGRTIPATGKLAPIRIKKNVLSGQQSDLLVSPQHRMLFQGYKAELLFGESEVLASATHLVDGHDVVREEGGLVTYVHFLLDQHEIVFAEGAASESFHPGSLGVDAVSEEAREELFAIFPKMRSDLSQYGQTARRCLKSHEAKLIIC